MEEKDFGWLCRLLASAHTKLSVPETLFFQGDLLDTWIYVDEGGMMRKRAAAEENIKTPLDACKYFFNKVKLLPQGPGPVCWLLSKHGRTLLDSSQFDTLPERKDLFIRVAGVQEYKEGKCWHKYQLRFEAGHGYTSTFTKSRASGVRVAETNARLLHKARDAALVILRCIEELKLKRVQRLDFDLVIDPGNVLWVTHSSTCAIAAPGLMVAADPPLEKTARNSVGRLRNYRVVTEKPEGKQQGKVMFKRGQLRSVDSNLNSPLRILSPLQGDDSPREPPTPEIVQTEPQVMGNSLDMSEQSNVHPPKVKPLLKSSTQRNFFNPNFQEMLIMGFLKQQGVSQYMQVADFQEEFYRALDGEDTGEISPQKNIRKSMQEAVDSFPANLSNSINADSHSSTSSLTSIQETTTADKLPPIVRKPAKRFNLTKRELYLKGLKQSFSTPLRPVLARSSRAVQARVVLRK